MKTFDKKDKRPFISAVISAGGVSARMKGENKLLLPLAGIPVIIHSLLAFEKCDKIDEIILASPEDKLTEYATLAEKYNIRKLAKVIKGGKSRLHSVYNAAVESSHKADFLLVHDAARPLITVKEIEEVINGVLNHNCAAASHVITDTVKSVEGNYVSGTIDRNSIVAVQTPQGADRDMLLAALKKAIDNDDSSVTDECSALEKIGIKPFMVPCSAYNIKITYPEDIKIANAIYNGRISE